MLFEHRLNSLSEKFKSSDFLLLEMKKIGFEKLPYAQSSLQRFIDSKTMDVHYNGHYKTYVKKLNDALSKKNYGDVELEDIIKKISKYSKTIRNNAGGAFNHALFWKMLSPTKKELPKEIKTKIIKDFGSYNNFKKEFTEVAKTIFGSGWAWLIITKSGKLKVMSTPNQDNPLMNIVDGGGFPILGLDTWEHAYYLKYKNDKGSYIENFWDVVNWDFVNDLYLKKQKSKLTESVRVIKEDTSDDGLPESEYIVNGRINPKLTQELLSKVYPKCDPEIITDYDLNKRFPNACYGKIDSDTCKTGYGVIGGKYAMSQRGGIGEWSVLNWFDGNPTISEDILDYFKRVNKEKISFKSWINKMKFSLYGEDRFFTEKLIPKISNPKTKKGSLDLGITRENTAVDILNSLYNQSKITRFCDGDTRDKFKGQDIMWNEDNVDKFVQVKSTYDLFKGVDENGQSIYVYKSKNKYEVKNIQIFAFIYNRNNYILFNNNANPTPIENDTKFKYSYTFKEDEIMKKEGNVFLKKLTESSRNKYTFLNEDEGDEIPNLGSSKKKPNKKPRQTKFNVLDKTIREIIHSVYPKCSDISSNINGCIGTIERERCVTGKGVIGGKFMESNYGGDSEWSLVNRWDANKNIHRKILEFYNDDSQSNDFGLEAWITVNRFELFSNDGKYTPALVELGSNMVTKGVKNETYAKNIIKQIYNLEPNQEGISWQLYNNCSGSINDTIYGQDIVLETNNTSYYFQVKQTTENYIKIVTDDRGNFYRVNSYTPHQKYKMEKVDVIVYVDPENDKYIFFKNDYNYIQTVGSGEYTYKFHINYYEEPLITNMNIEKISLTSSEKEEKELLKKTKQEKIKYYKERLEYFRQKLKELGDLDELKENFKRYKIRLMKLLI